MVFGFWLSMFYIRLVIDRIVKLDNKRKSGNEIRNFKKGVGFGKRLTKFYLINHTKHFKKELKAWCIFRIINALIFPITILIYCLLAFAFELNDATRIICYVIGGIMSLWWIIIFFIVTNSYGKYEIRMGQ